MSVTIEGVRTPGLGDSTYLLTYENTGILVDPQRDESRFVFDEQVQVRYVLETHLHNDYVSGARAAAERRGAELVLPAAAGAAYRYTPAFHMEDLSADGLTVRPIHTPGHTPEHTSYLILIDGEQVALFSGGSLLVGSAGRPDLLGLHRADTLARLQYGSLHRLADLDAGVGLYPTHGEGSFCTASGAGRYTSTIGEERATNPVLAHASVDDFVDAQLAGLQPYPKYYAHMGPANVEGVADLVDEHPPVLTPTQIRSAQDNGTLIVDARPRNEFLTGHIPGSLGVELRDDFGTWVGWIADFNAPIVLIVNSESELTEARLQLARIGFDRFEGALIGIDAWSAAGLGLDHLEAASAQSVLDAAATGQQVLDVRSPAEWEAGNLPGSVHRYLPDLVASVPDDVDPDRPLWLICGSGYRAAAAGGLLRDHGFDVRVFADGGVDDLMKELVAVG